MGMIGAMLERPEEVYALMKLKIAASKMSKQIPAEPHWGFSYSMLHKVSRSFALVIQQLGPQLRNAVCIFYLVLRALDTVEDDTSIPSDIKVPILQSFHRHIYDPDWHFSCGTKDYKVLMDKFHYVSTAFLELGKGYQEAIEDITKRMGAGMAKFICKEVETVDDYDEYCHYVAGLVGLGLSKLFHASGKEDLATDSLSNSMGLFLQKTNIIRDYLEDINEIPKSRMFWPRQIWSKYADKLEDFKYEENSMKAVQCLNDMVTNALVHGEDCLQYMSALKDSAIFRFCAIPQVWKNVLCLRKMLGTVCSITWQRCLLVCARQDNEIILSYVLSVATLFSLVFFLCPGVIKLLTGFAGPLCIILEMDVALVWKMDILKDGRGKTDLAYAMKD